MQYAMNDVTCTSCGDTVPKGGRISIKDRTDGRGKDILCFRCQPEHTTSAKIKLSISTETLSKGPKKPYSNSLRFSPRKQH